MIRLVVNPALDAGGNQGLLQLVTSIVRDPYGKDVGDHAAIIQTKRANLSDAVECLLVTLRERDPPGGKLVVEPFELHTADGGKQVAHVIAPALLSDVELPTAAALVALFGVLLDPQQTRVAHPPRDIGIGSHDGAAFTRRDVLDAIETEADDVADGANAFA